MLQARARAFEFQPTRSGTLIKFSTTIRCSSCPATRHFESIRRLPDEAVLKKFHEWGWLMGRNRVHDICPGCLGHKPENKLADRFKVTEGGKPVPTTAEVVDIARGRRAADMVRIGKVIDRHFPKTDRPILTITGCKAEPSHLAEPPPAAEEPAREQHEMSALDLMEAVLAELKGVRQGQEALTAEIRDIRAAHELMLEDSRDIHGEHAALSRQLDSLAGLVTIRNSGIAQAMASFAGTMGDLRAVADTPQPSAPKRRPGRPRKATPVSVTKNIRHPMRTDTTPRTMMIEGLFDQPPTPMEKTAIEPALARLKAVERPERKPRASRSKPTQPAEASAETSGRPRKRRQILVGG